MHGNSRWAIISSLIFPFVNIGPITTRHGETSVLSMTSSPQAIQVFITRRRLQLCQSPPLYLSLCTSEAPPTRDDADHDVALTPDRRTLYKKPGCSLNSRQSARGGSLLPDKKVNYSTHAPLYLQLLVPGRKSSSLAVPSLGLPCCCCCIVDRDGRSRGTISR